MISNGIEAILAKPKQRSPDGAPQSGTFEATPFPYSAALHMG